MTNPPLAGIRVLDLSSVIVGPYATQFLADYGADVTKVEAPGGDILRRLGGKSKSGELSPKFMAANRNKRSLAIDMKHPSAAPAVAKLLAAHDVVLTNMRPGARSRLGVDYDAARARRPDVIYCSIVGFGQEGPYRDKPAYDNVIQGVGGIAACHERQGGTPLFLPLVVADRLAGLMAVQAILLAVIHRKDTGQGQHIEVPMFENTAAFVLAEHFGQLIYPGSDGPSGDLRVLDPNAKPIRTKDGYICLSANSDKQAFALFEAFGKPELKDDPRFSTLPARVANIDAFNGLRIESLAKRTTAEWIAIFDRVDVPAMPYNTFEDLVADPHLNDVGLFETREHPVEGPVYNIRPAVQFSGMDLKDENLAPRLGQSSAEILRSVGMSEDEIAALIGEGVVIDRPVK